MEKITLDVHIENKAQVTTEEDLRKQDSQDQTDVKALNDTELREQLCAYGISPGPVLPSTRNLYENRLLQLMKQCPAMAAGNRSCHSETDEDGEKARTAEVVVETNNLKVTAECTSGLDNKPEVDVAERQKKLLSSDVEYSLAKIVAELQEILPEGKAATQHRSQGPRRRVGSSPERNSRQKRTGIPHEDYGYPDANVSAGQSTRRRAITVTPPSVKQAPESKREPEKLNEEFLPMRIKIAVFAIFIFILFVYVTMETNLDNPFTYFISGK